MANSGDINTSITNRQKISAGIKETLLKGASAYEMAVQEGYVGTEEEWLASLHGTDGTDGHTPEITSTKVGTREHKLYADGVEFASIFDGFDGADGKDGQDGQDGHSPEITATKSGKTVSIKVDGTEVATVSDGNDGSPGATGPSGTDGHTPVITATKSGKVTTIKADGTAIAEINDGNDGATGPQGPKGDPGALNFHICSQTEYDATTRVPTVQNPEDDTFYLVPSASVTSPDLFVEWIYVNNAWEMFGSATVDISGKADKVQNATNGNFAGLDNNGNLTDSGHSFTEINQELTSVKGSLSDLSDEVDGKYSKPSTGIPASDLASGVIPDVSGFYTKPSGGIPSSDLSSGIQTSLGKADTAYQKPSGGIPLTDLASNAQNVSGTTPSITGVSGMRYICDEVSTLSITPPASGDMEVIFESGSTATVLTVPNTVKFPAWFDPTDLEANCTYDIIITNGTLGVVTSWA